MPNPDGVIENRDLADDIITDRVLDTDLSTSTFTATKTFTGALETTASGTDVRRLEVLEGKLRGYTGDTLESAYGTLFITASGSGDSETLQWVFRAPSFLDDAGVSGVSFVSRSASADDSTTPPGWVFADSGASTQDAMIFLQNSVGMEFGDGSILIIPAETSDPSSPADGTMWLHTGDNALYIWEGGSKRTVASW